MSDPPADLEAWAASYRAARSPSPARRRAIAASVRAGIEAEDRRIRRQRWVGIGVLVAAGVLGALALGRLLDGAGTRVGRADDRTLAPHSAAGEPVHEAREGKVARRDAAAAPGESGTPSGRELEGTGASATASGGAAASSEPEPRSTPTRRRSGSEPADAPVADAPVADAPAADAPPDELESMRLLREAERKLEIDAAESLRLLERHAERFPSSTLSLEREALTVIALCRVGRAEAGRERQQAFLRRPGSSAYAKRVRSACEAPTSPAR